jgi:hypothetical protein
MLKTSYLLPSLTLNLLACYSSAWNFVEARRDENRCAGHTDRRLVRAFQKINTDQTVRAPS